MSSPSQEPARPETPAVAPASLLRGVEAELRRVRARAKAVLVLGAMAMLGSTLVASFLSVGLVDYLVRMPAWLRCILLLGVLAAMAIIARRWLLPSLRFRPALTDIALRLERTEEGATSGLRGLLASGLEFAGETRHPTPLTGLMGYQVAAQARDRFAALKPSSIITLRHTRQSLVALLVCALGALGVAALCGPRMFGIGFARVAAPWAGAQWPKRTELADATAEQVHALGTALPLRVAVTRTDQPAGQTTVSARYRVITPAGATPVTRVQLTGQGHAVAITDAGHPTRGELYERLVEPGALAAGAPADSAAELLYWFETRDDSTPPRRIRLVHPPAVVSARATIVPPAYAAALPENAFVSGALDLGTGADQRAVVGPVLGGSRVQLSITLSKPVPGPASAGEAAVREFLASAAPGAEFGPGLTATFDGPAWTLRWPASKTVRIPVQPSDEFGIRSGEEAAFSFDVAEDRAPSATVVDPRDDEPVLATAKIPLGAEGRDDVAIAGLSLSRQLARPASGSIGAAPEPAGQPVPIADRAFGGADQPALQPQVSLVSTLDLSALEGVTLKPGDELWIYATATDSYELDGQRHDPVRSAPRKLRIISEEQLIEQLRAELTSMRKVAMRLDEEQAAVQKAAAAGEVSLEDRRMQASITQRVQQQAEAIQRLRARVERNQLRDEAFTGLLDDLRGMLADAAEHSERAAGTMESAAPSPQAEKTPLSDPQKEAVGKAQEQVRDALQRVAETLDKGEDTWVVSRTLQKLLDQQRGLQAQTRAAGERNMGKRAEDMTAPEKAELQQLAEQQQRLSDAARRALDALGERATQMERADAAQAQGMKRAEDRGRKEQVPEKMQDAAKNIQQNQSSTAEAEQEEAAQSIQSMLDDLGDAQKNRADALRRQVDDLLKQLDALVTDQDTQLAAFRAAKDGENFAGLDQPMIALQNATDDTAAFATKDRSTGAIAELIERASKNQTDAITALRAQPPGPEQIEKSESESLRLLKLAKAEARKLKDQADKAEADKKAAELRQAYKEALEQQVALRAETDPYIGKTIDRRERLKVRALGEKQDALRSRLEEIHTKTAELSEPGVFNFAHERLAASTSIAAKKLRDAQADRAVSRNQASAIRVLKSLIDALDDRAKESDEFREEESGGGGAGGQGGGERPLIPPIAELKLLRDMQQEARDQTQAINEAADGASEGEVPALGQFQRDLAKRADELIKKLQKNQNPGQAPEPDKE
jgi:hypothetical protein